MPFTMADIDRLSRRVPHLCKVAPSSPDVHVEDVHRAGGIDGRSSASWTAPASSTGSARTVHARTLGDAIDRWDVMRSRTAARRAVLSGGARAGAHHRSRSARAAAIRRSTSIVPAAPFATSSHAFSRDGGLAVLFGNIAEEGCDRQDRRRRPGPPGVFRGPARVFESQDSACDAILADGIKAGDVVVIRYEGPRGGPGMQEMLYPTSYLKAQGLGQGVRPRHRRPLLGRQHGAVDRPRVARGSGRRRSGARAGRGRDRDRRAAPGAAARRQRGGTDRAAVRPWRPGATRRGRPRPGSGRCRSRSRSTRPWPPARREARCVTRPRCGGRRGRQTPRPGAGPSGPARPAYFFSRSASQAAANVRAVPTASLPAR